nr:immunoglobulin heavy chain junction region [Macaca mulatta]MOW49341.1 immunoglobulin heavy chain junction region [Macaca mulatta]MOW50223.1 immunoglobulin heavy chain junction region [Macaca mulatta]MOW50485.1 immunoglobulin heavy chain junction region [Macaca mulatta]MOW50725.1 immunoglobulin heavy chain junction region [Macaca mulatta]
CAGGYSGNWNNWYLHSW